MVADKKKKKMILKNRYVVVIEDLVTFPAFDL